ncbi:MAG TPA: TIM barrel protein [Blastocatellia bacterium]
MRPIGFSTGALAKSDFRQALKMMKGSEVDAVELSALRLHELAPLVKAAPTLDLSRFRYISVHVPSAFSEGDEAFVTEQLSQLAHFRWPFILHPDAIHDFGRWVGFGDLLCLENTDKRKSIGRTAEEIQMVFDKLPRAQFCLDIAHARQVDLSMTETYLLLKRFGNRLREIHISEVNTNSRHDPISRGAMAAFREIAHLIPEDTPAIIESPVAAPEIVTEIRRAIDSLTPERRSQSV